MDRQSFLAQLRESRLLSEEQLTGLGSRYDDTVPVHDLAAALVEEGVLTRFQAQQVWSGAGKGLVLGQYRILDRLGEGGFGQVYKALHALMDPQVAIKVIAPELVADSRAREWFRREVLACTELGHPNIVMAYDANEVEDVLFFVMEYVEGPNLDAFVKEHGPLPVGLACEVIRQAALALQHAHEKGLVHRDIKPANLLIPRAAVAALAGPAGPLPAGVLVKVADFGLARLQRTAKAGTLQLQNEKGFLGTPDYVSPEQAMDLHAVDIRSDLYSLGCTLYYALTGVRPFRGGSVVAVIVQHLEKDPEPVEHHRPEVTEGVCAIVRRLMAKQPEERYQTPADLAEALAPWCRPDAAAADGRFAALPAARGPLTAPPAPSGGATALVPQLAFSEATELSRAPVATAPAACAETPNPGAASATDRVAFDPEAVRPPSPAPGGPSADPFRASESLRRDWRQWVALVEAFSAGRSVSVSEPAYRALRRALLEACRSTAGGPRTAILERLEALVEPWLTARTLAATDRQTLASLLAHAAEIERELGGRERPSLLPLAALAAVLAFALALGWYASRMLGGAAVADTVDWFRELVVSRPLVALGVTLPAVLLGALLGLSRLLRAWPAPAGSLFAERNVRHARPVQRRTQPPGVVRRVVLAAVPQGLRGPHPGGVPARRAPALGGGAGGPAPGLDPRPDRRGGRRAGGRRRGRPLGPAAEARGPGLPA